MPHLRAGLLGAAVLAACVAAGSASAAVVPPPSLMGETFVAGLNSTAEGQTVFSVTQTCDQAGTFTFDASGVAAGPYPGTFVEHGNGQVSAAVNGDTGPVVAFHAEFWIMNDVGATIVHGTKDLVVNLANTGSCFSNPFGFDVIFDAATSYDATISTSDGSFRDTGFAHASGEGANTFGFFATLPEGEFDTFTETFDTSNGVVPVGGTGKVTGGGWILSPSLTDRVTFGLEAQSNPNGLHATCEVIDHATGTKIHCTGADSLVVTGTHATFSGPATVNGVATRYTIDVDDLGEPGTLDTFKIVTDSGYAAAGTLMGGNIQIHRS
jgi:hypothetical protein